MKAAIGALAAALWCACGSGADLPPCPTVPEVLPGPGTGTGSSASVSLVPGAEGEQRIDISADRSTLEYRFSRGGAIYIARYTLSRQPPPPAMRFVALRRAAPEPSCADQIGRGPVIDALEVRRAGVVVAHGEPVEYTDGRCPDKQSSGRKTPPDWQGPPDGKGFALGDGAIIWRLSAKVTLLPGDLIEVTAIGDSGDVLEILGSSSASVSGSVLGTIRGGGSVPVP